MTPEELAVAVADNPRHAAIHPALLLRVCQEEHAKFKKDRDRVKAVKNRLHQIHGAFEGGGAGPLLAALPQACRAGDERAAARAAMACHVSTRERLAHLDEFYGFVFEHLPHVRSVADVGCGLNPLFLAAVAHPAIAWYGAYDIDGRSLAALGDFFAACGQAGEAALCDAVTEAPAADVDVAFLFKLLPVLDAQRAGRGLALVGALSARAAVVTFPMASLGGRGRGMAQNYPARYEAGLAALRPILAKQVIGNELVYVLGPPAAAEDGVQGPLAPGRRRP